MTVGSVPVGRRNLFAEGRRAFLGIAGISVAVLMVLALDGIFAGVMRDVTRYIDRSPADVFVAQRGVRNMHMASSAVPLVALDRVRRLPGVRWAEPILYDSDALRAGDRRQLAYVLGYVRGGRGGPASLVEGEEPGPGEIVLDDRAARELRVGVGDRVEVLGRTFTVSGLTTGMTNIVNTVAFVGFADFAAARDLGGVASYLLVGARGDPELLARRIEGEVGLTALTRERFSSEEARAIRDMSAELMRIMVLAAFLIGLAVVGLMLYAATLSRLREVGVMKALGAGPARLARVVLSQAIWATGTASAVAVGLAFAMAATLEALSASFPLVVELPSIGRAVLGAGVIGALGAVVPLIKVSRVDPVTVFRRQT